MLKTTTLGLALLLALSACQDGQYAASTRHLAPIPPATLALMSAKGVSPADPILMRAYKRSPRSSSGSAARTASTPS